MAQSCACHAVCDRRIHVNNVIPTVYQGRVISTSLSAILASRGSYTLNQGTAGPREFHKLIVEAEKFPRRAGQPGARNWLSCSVITCPVWKMVTYSHWLNQTRNKYPCCLPDLETVEDSGIYKVFLPTLAFSLFPSSLPQNTYSPLSMIHIRPLTESTSPTQTRFSGARGERQGNGREGGENRDKLGERCSHRYLQIPDARQ